MKIATTIVFLLAVNICFAQSVNPKDFGAKGDNINDDLPAFNAAKAYAIANGITEIRIPNGIYRITNTFVIGGKGIQESDYSFTGTFNTYPSFNDAGWRLGRFLKPLKITGSGNTIIHADFADTVLKAAIYVEAPTERATSTMDELYNNEVSNLGIYCKNSWQGKYNTIQYSYSNNNQIGIFGFYAEGLKISNVTVYGFNIGIVLNQAYGAQLTNILMKDCSIGLWHAQSHRSNLINITTKTCNTGVVINSGSVVVNGWSSEHCKVALRLRNSNNIFKGCYFENAFNPGEAQVIVSDDGSLADWNVFEGLIVGCNAPNGDCLIMGTNAKRVTLTGTNFSGAYTFKNRTLNEVIATNCNYLSDPNIWVRDKNASFNKINLPSLKAAAGTKSILYVDEFGNIVK